MTQLLTFLLPAAMLTIATARAQSLNTPVSFNARTN